MVCVTGKRVIGSALTVMGFMAAGCQSPASSNQASALQAPAPAQAAAIRSDVTDIHPPVASATAASTGLAQTAAYQVAADDAAPQPVTYTTAATPAIAVAPAASPPKPAGAPASAGNTHMVRHGETLYSIARESYGTGKQWKKIALANPGVTAATLKVGQSLIIP